MTRLDAKRFRPQRLSNLAILERSSQSVLTLLELSVQPALKLHGEAVSLVGAILSSCR